MKRRIFPEKKELKSAPQPTGDFGTSKKDEEIDNLETGTKQVPHMVDEEAWYDQSWGNQYWIEEFSLKNKELKQINEGQWIDDKVVNAASLLIMKTVDGLGGCQDVITAGSYGFLRSCKGERFVQILNVRGSHWITIANVCNEVNTVAVYDSLHALNIRRCKGSSAQKCASDAMRNAADDIAISYPITLDQAACQLSSTGHNLTFNVVNVGQQCGGNDCGLYAIAFAAALALKIDPAEMQISQANLRPALIQSFNERSFKALLHSSVSKITRPHLQVLFTWKCKVHCHCRMPDDGLLTVKCIRCLYWYHN